MAVERRILRLYVLVDRSGSMAGDRIRAVNGVLAEVLPLVRAELASHPGVDLVVRVASFAEDVTWSTPAPVPIGELVWTDVRAGGRRTAMGAALAALASEIRGLPPEPPPVPPVIVLLSDGAPTDDFDTGLGGLLVEPLAQRATRVAIAIGEMADLDVLAAFTSEGAPPLRAVEYDDLLAHVQRVCTEAVTGPTTSWQVPKVQRLDVSDDVTLF